MTTIEYLSLPKFQRILVSIERFFIGIFVGIGKFFARLPGMIWKLLKKCSTPFYLLFDALVHGDWMTRTNFVIFGFSQLFRRQVAKGVLFLIYEIFFVFFMITVGVPNLSKLHNLGTVARVVYTDLNSGLELTKYFDNSFNILLYSIVSMVIIAITIGLWYFSIRDAKSLQDHKNIGILANNKEFFKNLGDKNYHFTLLSIPMVGLVVFTVIPIIFMIIVGFTNYNSYHVTPAQLFDWVGWNNYSAIFTSGAAGNNLFLETFVQVVLWTLIWAVFATFSNYFLGMVTALLINTKGIKLKKLWRTILVTTIAVPQFVSLLLISRMLNTEIGVVNGILKELGWISQNIKWLEDPILAKVVIIIVNTWVGIPYTMLTCTGILMNIPEDLYESARIDGASPFKMYMKITLPYMMFVTGPYLISSFIGNINNFNVIYLLSGGNPVFTFGGQNAPEQLNGVGQTDLLITWIYKMTMTNVYKDYGAASVLGVMIFIVVAFFSLITYSKTNAVKNEEDFQ